jgi:hypothetical protein
MGCGLFLWLAIGSRLRQAELYNGSACRHGHTYYCSTQTGTVELHIPNLILTGKDVCATSAFS